MKEIAKGRERKRKGKRESEGEIYKERGGGER